MLIIGIAGGSGSGKTTVVRALTEQLKEKGGMKNDKTSSR